MGKILSIFWKAFTVDNIGTATEHTCLNSAGSAALYRHVLTCSDCPKLKYVCWCCRTGRLKIPGLKTHNLVSGGS
jgi:hypothetical protein